MGATGEPVTRNCEPAADEEKYFASCQYAVISFQLRAEFRPIAPDGEGGTRVIQVQEKYLSVPGKCGTGKFGSLESWEDVLCKTGDTAVRCKNANVIVRR